MLRHSLLERAVGLVLQHTECRKLRRRPVALVEASEVKALVQVEGFVGDHLRGRQLPGAMECFQKRTHLGGQVQVLLLALTLLGFNLKAFFV